MLVLLMIPIFGTILSILSSLTGQLGPNYDPLFYDVMVYIFGTIMSVSYTHLTLPTTPYV